MTDVAVRLKQTFRTIGTDYAATAANFKMPNSFKFKVFHFFSAPGCAVTMYRIYRYLYVKGLRSLARFLWQFSTFLTGTDIAPTAEIGDYFYLGHSVGLVIAGKLGSHVSVHGQAGIGGGMHEGDIGGGPGLPVIGDHVQIGARALILGAIHVGDRSVIGPLTLVTKSVPPDSLAIGNPCKIISKKRFTGEEGDHG